MTKRVAQIQQRPQSGFLFVRGDNICFSLTVNPNRPVSFALSGSMSAAWFVSQLRKFG